MRLHVGENGFGLEPDEARAYHDVADGVLEEIHLRPGDPEDLSYFGRAQKRSHPHLAAIEATSL